MSIAIIFPISYFVQLLLVQAASYYVHRGQSESVSGKVGSHEARKLHQRRKPKRQIKGGVHYFVTELSHVFKAVSAKKILYEIKAISSEMISSSPLQYTEKFSDSTKCTILSNRGVLLTLRLQLK